MRTVEAGWLQHLSEWLQGPFVALSRGTATQSLQVASHTHGLGSRLVARTAGPKPMQPQLRGQRNEHGLRGLHC